MYLESGYATTMQVTGILNQVRQVWEYWVLGIGFLNRGNVNEERENKIRDHIEARF